MKDLVENCCKYEANQRCSFQQICELLQSQLEDTNHNNINNLNQQDNINQHDNINHNNVNNQLDKPTIEDYITTPKQQSSNENGDIKN